MTSTGRTQEGPVQEGRILEGRMVEGRVLAVLGGFLILRAWLAAVVPLIAAEAYYWRWSLDLAAGYVDHPPGVAVTILIGSLLDVPGSLGMRFGSVLLGTFGAGVFWVLVRDLFGSRTAFSSLVMISFALFFMPFGIVATPDAPLLALWPLALLTFWRAWGSNGWFWWLATGVVTGACILGKYNGMQLPIVYFVFLVATPQGRKWLVRPQPWVALVLVGGLITPNLLWNAGQSGVTLATPVRDGLEVDQALIHLGEYLLLPVVWMTPLLWFGWVWRSVTGVRDGRLSAEPAFLFCFVASWIPLLCFGPVSLLTGIHIHWISHCLVAAVPLTMHLAGRGPGPRFLVAAGVVQGLIVAAPLALVLSVLLTDWVPAADAPTVFIRASQEFRGRGQVAARLEAELERHAQEGDGELLLMSKDYHLASILSWMVRDQVPTLPLRLDRFRQYSVSYVPGAYAGWDAIFVDKDNSENTRKKLERAFESVERLPDEVVQVGGVPIRAYAIYLCHGFSGPY